MLRLWLGSLLALVLGTTGAVAGGYDDFAHGMIAFDRGDDDHAIQSFTAALADGDLNAGLVPVAYLDRARIHIQRGDCAQAASDLSEALKVKADYADAYFSLGLTNLCLADQTAAQTNFTRAIELRPTAEGYFGRSRSLWSIGNFTNAAEDAARALGLSPRNAYAELWFAMSRQRAGTFDARAFAKNIDVLNWSGWPAPIFLLYEGESKPEDVFLAIGSTQGKLAKERRCEANFYVAEWWIARGDFSVAAPLLEDAKNNCPDDYLEKFAAIVELKRSK
jgi:lipoprotein NlpI